MTFTNTNALPMALRASIAEVVRLGLDLGRKFEPQDVIDNPWLRKVATDYALASEDTSGFMWDMANAASGRYGLSNGQAKGVLNVIMARQRNNAAGAQASGGLPNVAQVPSARYRVVQPDGQSIAIRLDSAAWAQDKPKGTRCVAVRTADGWFNVGFIDPDGSIKLWKRGIGYANRLTPALTTVANGVADGSWLVYALSYAQEGGECAFCGKELDTQESLTVGYGPTCAKRHGLPWGAKAVPMTVLLAQQAAGQPAPTPDADALDRMYDNEVERQMSAEPLPKRTYDEVFGGDDAWGERKEFIDNTVNDAPAPGSLLDLALRIQGGSK